VEREAMMITIVHFVDMEILQPKNRETPQKDLIQPPGSEDRSMKKLVVRYAKDRSRRPM
jgi:hypothetical protein